MLDARDNLIAANMVAFLHQDLRDPALRVRAYVDVIPRFNFARCGHDRGEIGFRSQSGLHGNQVALAPAHTRGNAADDEREHNYSQYYFPLAFHERSLPAQIKTEIAGR